MATDVDFQLDQRILSGEVKTKLFSVHLNDTKLVDIIEVFCSKVTVDIPLIYVNKGKSIFIKPNFIKKVADDIRLPFLIFDKKGTFHSESGKATAYIEKIEPIYENKRFSGFIVYPKEFLKEAPILQAINNDFQFTLPKKINTLNWKYRIPEFEGTGFMDSGKYDEPPAVLFKLEIIR
jgi:hypothetical protein